MEKVIKNLMFDLASGKEIYDEETNRVISKDEANEILVNACYSLLGLNEKSTKRDIERALKRDSANEFFAVVEEIIDKEVSTGFNDNEFFDTFVETRNVADGDEVDFYVEDDTILNVAKVSGDNHDVITQKLGAGQMFNIPVSNYVVKAGTDIRMFLTGRKNWSDFIDAVAKAYVKEIKSTVYTEVMSAGASIPASAQFNKTGELKAQTKDTFDTLIEDVEAANDGAPVVIIGTKTALKKINNLADVNWRSNSQKESVAKSGILGDYEGNVLIEIPQRFANNTTASKLVDSTKLLIMPQVDNKFIKFVDYGETSLEVTEKGDTMNDQQTVEANRKMGVGTVISKYFGTWTLE